MTRRRTGDWQVAARAEQWGRERLRSIANLAVCEDHKWTPRGDTWNAVPSHCKKCGVRNPGIEAESPQSGPKGNAQ